MKRTILMGIFGAAAVLFAAPANSQVEFKVGGDLVSSYVWRGMYQSGAALQPTLGLSVKGFSLTAWGSVDITGQGHKEADFTAAYSVKGLTISLTDYWWAGQSGIYNKNVNGSNNYFHWKNKETSHIVEAGLSYTLPVEKFPLAISWYTMVYGGDKKANGDQAYSSYAELAYPFHTKWGLDWVATLGFSPYASYSNYKTSKFDITNISLKATKTIKFNDRFSLPIFTQVVFNPNREDVHFVLGLSI